MISFFNPSSKVQKDRKIMRETDARMAKYSRRGLLFNFVAFLVCFIGGDFFERYKVVTIILLSGLLLITVLRGFYLFRFEQLYPHAPARWRNQYFIVTLLGSIWWAVIMCTVTLTLKMESEAPIFWLYTVIFFSTTAHALAPFQKFLSWYQFFGLIPGAVSAFFLFSLDGYLYGLLMFAFYFMLIHQCKIVSQNYWEKLETEYVLSRKKSTLEREKRDSLLTSTLSKDFVKALSAKLELSELNTKNNASDDLVPNDTLNKQVQICDKLVNTVSDFNLLINKQLDITEKVFNVRHELQHTMSKYVELAEQSNVDIESSLSSNLPMRLVGDAKRLAQTVNAILNLALTDLEQGSVVVEADFFRDEKNSGELKISVVRENGQEKKTFFSDERKREKLEPDMDFYLCKGIAQKMGGVLEMVEPQNNLIKFSFSVNLTLAESSGKLDFHRNLFSGHRVMLIHSNPKIVDIKRQELEALGFTVVTETQYARAEQVLQQSCITDAAIESVIFYSNDTGAIEFNNKLIGHDDLRSIQQLIVASLKQQGLLYSEGFAKSDNVHFVDRPCGLFELECAFLHLYDKQEEAGSANKQLKLLYYSNLSSVTSVVQKVIEPFQEHFYQATSEKELMQRFTDAKNEIDLIMIDTKQVPNYSNMIEQIRAYEQKNNVDVFVPIVGLVSSEEDIQDTAYERGIDDFIVIEKTYKNVERVIRYWATLHEA